MWLRLSSVIASRPRWLAPLGAVALTTSLLATVLILRGEERPATRVAISVACTDCALVDALALDVWSEQRGPGMPLDVVVRDRDLEKLATAGLRWQVLVPDIDEAARAEALRLRMHVQTADWYDEYKDYRAISARLEELAARHPERVSLHGIGSSLDGRPLWALRIGGTTENATPMLVNGTQHAREWISAMVTTCVADRLASEYERDPAIRQFVDSTTLWVVPVVNPDGYQYSWSSNRYWRKNRRNGHGVDLNRNFSVAWGNSGSSSNKRSDVYRGEAPFSEPETLALRDLARREQIALHLDVHSYGQLLLYPWGYTATPAPDRDRLAALGDRMASAMFATHGTRYRLMSSVELYPTGGTMTDWAYGEAKALSYTIELRPRGGRGFVLPPEEIKPTCDEGLAAVLALRAGLN